MMANKLNGTNETETSGLILFYTLHGYGVGPIALSFALLAVAIGTAICVLNAMVLHAIRLATNASSKTSGFITSLAVADFFVGSLLIYNTVYNIVNYQSFEECFFRHSLLRGVTTVSVYNLLGLTVDRYLNIIFPLKYKHAMSKTRYTTIAVVFVWVFAMLFVFSPTINPVERPNTVIQCAIFYIFEPWYIIAGTVVHFASVFVMIALYAHMFVVVQRKRKGRSQMTTLSVISKNESSKRRRIPLMAPDTIQFTKTVILLTGVFFVCWTPTAIFLTMVLFGHFDHVSIADQGEILQNITWLGFLNSLFNPIIYALKIPHIKPRIHQMCCTPRCC